MTSARGLFSLPAGKQGYCTSESKVQKPAHKKAFYFMAYINLVFVFLITFVIALWKWS